MRDRPPVSAAIERAECLAASIAGGPCAPDSRCRLRSACLDARLGAAWSTATHQPTHDPAARPRTRPDLPRKTGHREPRSWRARVRSASRASSLSPFKAPKFAFDNGLCSKLRSSNARWWRASASAACSGVSGTAGAFTGPCSCARPSLRSGRGLCGRRGVPEPASSGRPGPRCTPGWGGRERRGAWPG